MLLPAYELLPAILGTDPDIISPRFICFESKEVFCILGRIWSLCNLCFGLIQKKKQRYRHLVTFHYKIYFIKKNLSIKILTSQVITHNFKVIFINNKWPVSTRLCIFSFNFTIMMFISKMQKYEVGFSYSHLNLEYNKIFLYVMKI